MPERGTLDVTKAKNFLIINLSTQLIRDILNIFLGIKNFGIT